MLKVVCLIFLSASFCDCVFTPAGFNPYNGAPRRSYLVSSLANTLHSSSNQAAPKSANNLGPGGSPPTQPQYVAPQQPQVLEHQKQPYGRPEQPQQLQYGQQPPNGQPQQPQYGQQPQNGQPQQSLYGQQPQNGQPQQPLYGQQPQAQYSQLQQQQYDQRQQSQVLQPQQPQYGEPQQAQYGQQPLPQAQQPQYGQSQQTQQAQYGELQQQQQYDQLQQSQVLQPQQPQYGSQPQNVQSQQSQVQQPQQLQYDQQQQPQDVQPVQTETAQPSQRPTAKLFPNLQERLSAFKSSTGTDTAQTNTESNTGTPSIEPRTLPFAHLRASFKRNSRPTASAAAVPPAPQVPVTPAPQVPVTPAPQAYDPPAPQAYDPSVPQTYVPPVPQNYAPTATQQHTQPAPQQHTPQASQHHAPQTLQHHAQPAAQQYAQPAPQQYVPPAQQQYVPPAQQQYAQPAPQQYSQSAPQQYAQSAPQQYVPPENQQYAPPTPQQYVPPAQQQYVAPAPQKTSSPTLFPHFARPQPKQTVTRPLPKPIGAPSPQARNSTQQNAQPGLIINHLGTLTIPPRVTNTQSPPFIISPADFDPNIDSNVDGTTPPMEVTQKPKILMNIYYSHDNTYHKPPVGQQVPVQVSRPKPRKPPADRTNLPKVLDANNFLSYFEDKQLEKSFGVTKKQKYAILEEMNKRRANIRFQSNINVLRWNETLAERAAAEINSCLYFNKGNGAIYAMIYEKHTGTSLISEAVNRWADEKNKFRLASACNETKACRYSQIVWADTKEVGCARQTCNDMSMVACMYHPPGNVIGGKAYEPGRPCTRCGPGSKCNTDNLCEW